jgi:hypothetical protein
MSFPPSNFRITENDKSCSSDRLSLERSIFRDGIRIFDEHRGSKFEIYRWGTAH